MSFRRYILLLGVFEVIFLFSSKCDGFDDSTKITEETIYDNWIRSQTSETYYAPATSSPPVAATGDDRTKEEKVQIKNNITTFMALIDTQYASMKPSDTFSQFSKIRADALFLQFYSLMKNANGSEELLPEVYDYFEQWPVIPIENWRTLLPAEKQSQYLKYAEKYVTEPPPLQLRWIIFSTWLIKTDEWKDSSKVPQPMLGRFILLAKTLIEDEVKVVEFARNMVRTFEMEMHKKNFPVPVDDLIEQNPLKQR